MAETPEAEELHRALAALGEPARRSLSRRRQARDRRLPGARQAVPDSRGDILDRTVMRVFPTGARLTLTHNIIRVQNKDGIDKWGEVAIPESADVLLLRNVKADGTTRDPEEIAEKQSVSVPDLEPGDFVEFEYVEQARRAAGLCRGISRRALLFRLLRCAARLARNSCW